jgi:macrodomain Ter protein organizer (MatP/YcbG family)
MSIELAEQPLDGRATVEIDLDREEWYQLMMMAHERDITLNQMVEQLLREAIAHYDQSLPTPAV